MGLQIGEKRQRWWALPRYLMTGAETVSSFEKEIWPSMPSNSARREGDGGNNAVFGYLTRESSSRL